MSKVTPPKAAGDDSETVNAYDVVPEFPSFCETPAIETMGNGLHNLIVVKELRAAEAAAARAKSTLFTSVSEQPAPARTSAVVLFGAEAAAVPSEQLTVP
jgi:glycerate-2-kinase